MNKLFEAMNLKHLKIKNRICVPPMVCYNWVKEDGCVVHKNIEHYRAIARGGAGLIIQEATCVDPEGKLSKDQLGIWEDRQIDGLKEIVGAVHEEGCPIFLQIHHAGVNGSGEYLLCPSDYEMDNFNSRVNKRTDEYGRHPEKFALEILEKHGINFLDISYGFSGEDKPEAPKDFPYKDVIHAAGEIKKHVSVPVFAVNSITDARMAEDILERTGVDMVDIGRGVLVNYNWAIDAREGRNTGRCLHCKECQWRIDAEKCAGRVLLNRKRNTGE